MITEENIFTLDQVIKGCLELKIGDQKTFKLDHLVKNFELESLTIEISRRRQFEGKFGNVFLVHNDIKKSELTASCSSNVL